MFKPSGLPLAFSLLLFSILILSLTLAAQSEPKLIAQSGKGEWNRMMDEKCREWENSKNAPPSPAWTCVNGRAATQAEASEQHLAELDQGLTKLDFAAGRLTDRKVILTGQR